MARHFEPTPEQVAIYDTWVAERPDVIRAIAERLVPWELYRLKTTGQRVTMLSFTEDGTVCVEVSGDFNLVEVESQIAGVDPNDLEPCELPGPDEITPMPAKDIN